MNRNMAGKAIPKQTIGMCTASESACIWRASLASGCGWLPRLSTTCCAKTVAPLTSAPGRCPVHPRDRLVVERRRAPRADPREAEQEPREQVERAGDVVDARAAARAREPQAEPCAHHPLGGLEERPRAALVERAREPAEPLLVDARHRQLGGHRRGLDRPERLPGRAAGRQPGGGEDE